MDNAYLEADKLLKDLIKVVNDFYYKNKEFNIETVNKIQFLATSCLFLSVCDNFAKDKEQFLALIGKIIESYMNKKRKNSE